MTSYDIASDDPEENNQMELPASCGAAHRIRMHTAVLSSARQVQAIQVALG